MRNEFGVKALTVKISEGTTFKDGYAASNIANGQAAGLYVNGYHFAHYKTKAQAIAEADYAGQAAKAARLPVGAVLATDVESAEEQGILSQATNDRNNAAFMKEIQKFGYRADIYTSGSWANNKMTIKGKTGWVAGYPYVMSGQKWYTNNNAWQWSGSAHFRISYGGFDVSQLYTDYYTAGQKSTVKPTNKDAVKANNQGANKNTSKPSTSAKWVKEAKTYTLKTAVKLRTGASTSSNAITILPAGTTVKTDQAIIQGGYRWVRQPRSHGYGYLA
ncbi:GH25 family lysozyme, partial [Lactiplantibacillus paraplantarum]|uniref:GH25 family lysozyme n=1 Tax=Lactiplantibacillus paraplantarum TaxID=60520 RepID=UPI0011BFDC45